MLMFTTTSNEYEWSMGDPSAPRFSLYRNSEDCCDVLRATVVGKELSYMREEWRNVPLPPSLAGSATWYGDWAKFVVANMPYIVV